MSNHLNLQVCIFPRFDGGVYFTVGKGTMNRMVRLAHGFIDFRVWWVITPGIAMPNRYPGAKFGVED